MRRYRELEAEAEAEAARYMQQAAEAGQQRGPGGNAGPEVQPNLVPLGPEDGCRCARPPRPHVVSKDPSCITPRALSDGKNVATAGSVNFVQLR